MGESLQASTTQTLNKNEGTIGKGLIYEEPSEMYSAPATVTLNGDGYGQSQTQTRQNTTTTHRPGAGLACLLRVPGLALGCALLPRV